MVQKALGPINLLDRSADDQTSLEGKATRSNSGKIILYFRTRDEVAEQEQADHTTEIFPNTRHIV
jgi:hypothetical protein